MRVWLDPDSGERRYRAETDCGWRLTHPGSRVGRAILARRGPRTGQPRSRSPETSMAAVQPGALPHSVSPVAPVRPRRQSRPKVAFPYLNRELAWLDFNDRVLHEARDERNPLLERVKFLAIFAGNLDEFFQVRIAGLRQQVEAGKVARSPDGRTPDEQLGGGPPARPRPRRRAFGGVRRRPALPRRRRHRAGRLRRDPRAPPGPSPAVLRRDLPGPDARSRSIPGIRSRTSRR